MLCKTNLFDNVRMKHQYSEYTYLTFYKWIDVFETMDNDS